MRQFYFTFATVQKLRLAEEQAAQKAVAAAIRAREEAALRLGLIESDLGNARRGFCNGMAQGLWGAELIHAHAWGAELEQKQKQFTREVEAAQAHLRKQQYALREATRRRQALDRLRNKKQGAYTRAVQSEEQKFLDEIATRRSWDKNIALEAV